MKPTAQILALLLSILLVAAPVSPQDFETYWEQIREAAQSNRRENLDALVARSRPDAERAFWRAVDHYVTLEVDGRLDEARTLRTVLERIANAFYTQHEDTDLVRYTGFVTSLGLADKEVWLEAFGHYHDLVERYTRLDRTASPDRDEVREAVTLGESLLLVFDGLHDDYLQGKIHAFVGILESRVGDLEASRRALERSLACFRTVESSYQAAWVEARLRRIDELLHAADREGLDDRAGHGVGPGEGRTWVPVEMRYVVDPDGFPPTENPATVDEYLLWNRFLLPADHPASFHDGCETDPEAYTAYVADVFGRWSSRDSLLLAYAFLRHDADVGLDLDGDGSLEKDEVLAISTKPGLFQFHGLASRDRAPFRYAVQMVELGDEFWFGKMKTRFVTGDERAFAFRRACHREGEFQGQMLLLVDDNSNGCYSDVGADSLFVQGGKPSLLGSTMRIGDRLYEVRVPDPRGERIELRPWNGTVGRVRARWSGRVPPACLFIRGVDRANLNAVLPVEVESSVVVPVGRYRLFFGAIRRGEGRRMQSVEIREGRSEPFEVKPREETSLVLGAPFDVEFEVESTPEGTLIPGCGIRIFGAGGELYTRFYDEPPTGEVTIRRPDGTVVEKARLRRVEAEDRLRDPGCAWHPKDLTIDRSKIGGGTAVEAKFRLDAPLLGSIRTEFIPPR